MTAPAQAPSLNPTDQATAEGQSRLGLIARGLWTVLQFEFRKSRTWKRMLVWAGVAMFPAFIIALMLFADDRLPRAGWVSIVFVMACEMVVILNAMLWVAPIVQAELEGKTWLYVVTRPYGRFCLVLGKLVNGVTWTLGAGLLALALVGGVSWIAALPVKQIAGVGSEHDQRVAEAQKLVRQLTSDPKVRQLFDETRGRAGEFPPFQDGGAAFPNLQPHEPEVVFDSVGDALEVGGVLAALAVLGGLAYSSLFCGIGCIIPKRAMLIAFSYTLIFETVVAFVPAIINRLTIQYHLRCLLNRWVDLDVPAEGEQLFFSDWLAAWHVAVLLGMIVLWQIVSLTVIHFRQYVMTDET
ncbi:ABC-2 family transporter protein [Caulifigura coniformis]|uniref:ABC-2 family transporter protein n=1 Tax=Caulifigura coniformis TaxID=2527983 RepID=A0A517SAU7_9PLAN|nr:ABC transporter permease [Caulifigura coniformis]QDT53251.1 ABC-2 family transporter protein [Caulifigura coniformis]